MNIFIYRHEDHARQEFVNGHYELRELKHAVVDGHDVLYCLGNALLDNSCCGSFGCAYALVIGERLGGAADGAALTVREIDAEEALAEHIRNTLFEREAINTVNFYLPPLPSVKGASA